MALFGKIGPLIGQNLAPIRPTLVPNMAKIRPLRFGRNWATTWPKLVPELAKVGPYFAKIWPLIAQHWAPIWPKLGPHDLAKIGFRVSQNRTPI